MDVSEITKDTTLDELGITVHTTTVDIPAGEYPVSVLESCVIHAKANRDEDEYYALGEALDFMYKHGFESTHTGAKNVLWALAYRADELNARLFGDERLFEK